MLAVWLFVAFWVLLALTLFFIASRGGLGGARATLQTQARRPRQAIVVTFVVIYIGFGVVLPVLFLTGNHANANAQIGGIKLTAAEQQGRLLFAQHCGVCHTLAGANAIGKVGPNLDTLRPPASLVYNTIVNGCEQNAPSSSPQACLGYGTMPSNILQGRDAQDVAQFVGKIAGRE